jgi:hypothetical protein
MVENLRHDIAEILLKVALNFINQTSKNLQTTRSTIENDRADRN